MKIFQLKKYKVQQHTNQPQLKSNVFKICWFHSFNSFSRDEIVCLLYYNIKDFIYFGIDHINKN